MISGVYEIDIRTFILISITPLIPFDIIKVILACSIFVKIEPIIERI